MRQITHSSIIQKKYILLYHKIPQNLSKKSNIDECSPRVNDKNTLATSPNKSSSKDLQKVKATPKPIISKKRSIKEKKYDNGDYYIGEILQPENIKQGKGKLFFNNTKDNYYEGEFVNDIYEGYGTLVIDNVKYKGNFHNGMKNGYGKLNNSISKNSYEGEWKDDMKNGQGKETYPDGSTYEGTFLKGKKEGKGKLYLLNGTIYEGSFKDDMIDGNGKIKWNNNTMCIGHWKNNVLSGFGKLYHENDIYVGYFDNDKKNGLGINFYFNSKSQVMGKWVDDAIEGLAIFASKNNQEMKFWEMQNKKISYSYSKEEIESKVKHSEEYKRLKEFYICLKEAGEISTELGDYEMIF